LSLRDGPLGDIRVPLTWSAAAALVIAIIIAAALLLSRQHDPMKVGAYDAARRAVDVVEAPVGGVVSAPVRWTHDGADYVRGYFFAVSENRRLKSQLVEAQATRDQLEALQIENARLRAVLGIRTDPPLPHIAAETIADSRGPFANTRLANAGRDKGVTEGNPVVSEHGLIGRVVGVSDHVSRVLMLTDAESRTPVLLVRTNGRAILSGDGGGSPKLDFVRSTQDLKEGDRVLTSGDGGVFPRGLPVGTVVRGLDGGWHVALDSDAAPIDFVQILLFTDFAQLVDERALAPKDLPTAMTEEPSPSIVGLTTSAPVALKPGAVKPATAKLLAAPAGAKPAAASSIKAPAAKAAARLATSPAAGKPAAVKAPAKPKLAASTAKPADQKTAAQKPAAIKPAKAKPAPVHAAKASSTASQPVAAPPPASKPSDVPL
jgi:rod shape-determining protein MreC